MDALRYFATHPVFTREDFASARPEERSDRTVDSLLAHHVRAGRVLHVRRGLYASVPFGMEGDPYSVDPYLVASRLGEDATVSHHAALQFFGRVYSVWASMTVMTNSRFRGFTFQGTSFERVAPAAPLDRLVTEVAHAGGYVRVTSLERTLVDVLAAPKHAGGWEEVWRSLEMVEYVDLDSVVEYALALNSPLVVSRVGFYLEQHRDALWVQDHHLDALQQGALRTASYLDGKREPGRLMKRWQLIVPEWVLDRAWEEVA